MCQLYLQQQQPPQQVAAAAAAVVAAWSLLQLLALLRLEFLKRHRKKK
jgi:hypothetical protein